MNSVQKKHIREFRMRGASYGRIAKALGISINTVKSFCRRNNLTKAKTVENEEPLAGAAYCQNCGRKILVKPKQKLKKFCSYACRMTWWKDRPELVNRKAIYHFRCAHCGTSFSSYGNKNRKYCSHPCYIKDRFGKEAGEGA